MQNMKMRSLFAVILLGFSPYSMAEVEKGFYIGANALGVRQDVKKMEGFPFDNQRDTNQNSAKKSFLNGSLSIGYQWNSAFRSELEYLFPHSQRHQGRASHLAGDSYQEVKTQRLMWNNYLSTPLGDALSFYGMAGVGIAQVTTSGRSLGQMYAKNRQYNFAWNVGFGLSYQPFDNTYIDFGIRHVNLGKARSGRSGNGARLKGKIASNEVVLGLRYVLGELYQEELREDIYADHVTEDLKESFERAQANSHSFRAYVEENRMRLPDEMSRSPKKIDVID